MSNQSSESNAGETDPATATANNEPAVDHGLGEQDEDVDFVLCRGRKRVRGLRDKGLTLESVLRSSVLTIHCFS